MQLLYFGLGRESPLASYIITTKLLAHAHVTTGCPCPLIFHLCCKTLIIMDEEAHLSIDPVTFNQHSNMGCGCVRMCGWSRIEVRKDVISDK
jgi:hypothetical protein